MTTKETTPVIDVVAVKDYLGIDFTDDMTERRLERLVAVADKFMIGALGHSYPVDDERVQELMLMIIADLYDNRELTQKQASTYRKLAHDFELQIRMEMRGQNDVQVPSQN